MKKRTISILLCAVLIFSSLLVAYGNTKTVNRTIPTVTYDLPTWRVAPSGAIAANYPQRTLPTPPDSDAEAIAPTFDTSGWIEIPVPGSLLGGLLSKHVYDGVMSPDNEGNYDIMFDNNITKIPDDFSRPWWYSTDVVLTADDVASGKFQTLTFKGISYTGEVYVNGTRVYNSNLNITNEDELRNRRLGDTRITGEGTNLDPGTTGYTYVDVTNNPHASGTAISNDWSIYSREMQGAFRQYELPVTGLLRAGTNNIKVKVARGDRRYDFNYNFHDWHMAPVCRDMGINNPAYITITGAVRLSNPFVGSVVNAANTSADVSFFVNANNPTNSAINGTVYAILKDPQGNVARTFDSGTVVIPANAYCWEVPVTTQTIAGNDLKLWWPYLNGDQPLYNVEYKFVTSGVTTDTLNHRFGIREITAEVNKFSAHNNSYMLQYFVNGKPIVIKGGGYCPTDLYLRNDNVTDQQVVDLLKEMGMNAIRDEGKFFNDHLYDLFDENGIMLLTGFMCCDRNQDTNWAKVERFIVYEAIYSQMRSLRAHPSFITFINGSDNSTDNGSGENEANTMHKMLEIQGRLRVNEHGLVLPSASGLNTGGNSRLIGAPGGIEMEHGYDTTVPTTYYAACPAPTDNLYTSSANRSGMFGFISEGLGGGAIPPAESLKKFIPTANLWPKNVGGLSGSGSPAGTEDPGNYNKWDYHACRGGSNFNHIDKFTVYTDSALGDANHLEEWVSHAYLYEYEYQRAQYEALNYNRYVTASGLINWMLNGTRPVIMWNQFDFYLHPTGATFGVGKANEPVHIMYNIYNKSINVINTTFDNIGDLTAEMKLYDINGNVVSSPMTKTFALPADSIDGYVNETNITNRVVGFNPVQYNGNDWYEKAYTAVTRLYGTSSAGRRVNSAPGKYEVWSAAQVNDSMIMPTSDVYFMRLELKNSANEVISYNTYAVPRRQDVNSGTGSGLGATGGMQASDWTQLKQLPEINFGTDVTVSISSAENQGNYIVQKVTLKNNTDKKIVHGLEVKSYMDATAKDLCQATYDDNFITLFPGQTRIITVKHLKAYLNGPATIKLECFNNFVTNRPSRGGNVYIPSNPVAQTTSGTTDSTPNATTNLARNRQYSINGGNFVNGNATSIANVDRANNGTTVIDSDINTNVSIPSLVTAPGTPSAANIAQWQAFAPAATGNITVDLAAVKTFDRVMLRFNNAHGTNMMGGTPNYVMVQVSDSSSGPWEYVDIDYSKGTATEADRATFDNTKSRVAMANIVFKAPAEARYVRFTFTGLTLGSTSYGAGPGSISSQTTSARANPSAFIVSGIDIYNSYNYVLVGFDGKPGSISADSGTALTAASSPMSRSLKAYAGIPLELLLTPTDPSDGVMIYMNGELADLRPIRVGNGYKVVLEDINAYTELTAKFISGESDDFTFSALVEDKDALFIVALYDVDSGRLEGLKSKLSRVAADNWRQVTIKWDDLPSDLTGKEFRIFVWDGTTYTPVAPDNFRLGGIPE